MSSKKVQKDVPEMKTCWVNLFTEISIWKESNKLPQFFLRDDDAIEVTPNLIRLVELCDQYQVPLLLAVIPHYAKKELADYLKDHPLVTPAVHGYQHKSHTPKGVKSCELDGHRPLNEVVSELRLGKEKLTELFGEKLSTILVPPWNRIHEPVVAQLKNLGFGGLSTHGWKPMPSPVKILNTHVDIIHWSAGKVGREHNWVIDQLTTHLTKAREEGFQPIGILTHHLDHDEKAWSFLEMFFENMKTQEFACWESAQKCLEY